MRSSHLTYLEKAARQTILYHRADTLVRMILRTIVTNMGLLHAGMFIYDKNRKEYVAQFSRGASGMRIPAGFAKIRPHNPLIRYFTDKTLPFTKDNLLLERIGGLKRHSRAKRDKRVKNFLESLEVNLSLYGACACIPGFFRKDLIGLLFLGAKKNNRALNPEELDVLSVLSSDVVMSLKNAWLIEDLNHQLALNKRLFVQTVAALASSIEAKDKYTIGHTERVVKHALAIANNLRGRLRPDNSEKFLQDVRTAALLHDIGKIGVPESILCKVSSLNHQERLIIQQHPLIGANILQQVEEFKDVLLGVRYHHERYDGSGYPAGLKKQQIPLIASIIALADSFDAMTIDRPYQKALSLQSAIDEIKKNKGRQFTPCVVDAFLKIYPHRVRKTRQAVSRGDRTRDVSRARDGYKEP
ncbi:MAG: HD-GYP domain-containing protein [Candidatus Omnitrophota bacterium]|nr:HD-GYP domain-containing protein [Candidatus Omnitrophota bacterium]